MPVPVSLLRALPWRRNHPETIRAVAPADPTVEIEQGGTILHIVPPCFISICQTRRNKIHTGVICAIQSGQKMV